MREMREGQGAPAMIPSAEVLVFFQSVAPPEPGKEVYWIAGLMAGAIGFLFYRLTQVQTEALKRAQDREDTLLAVDTARTETMRQLVAQVETAARLTQTVVDGSLNLSKGIEGNAKSIDTCNKTIEGLTLELRNMALRLQDAGGARATDKGP